MADWRNLLGLFLWAAILCALMQLIGDAIHQAVGR